MNASRMKNSQDTARLASAFGFELDYSSEVKEIEGAAFVFRHETGARLLYLANEDNNKGFSITFKTPAADDTGVFHILEHSVLCGSEKYPVKEPFVNLLKSSMQTFLNAMTFPDKTMYPVASTNDKDLHNLASVYLDAVFHPNIYRNRRIFEQEGWHLEYDAEDEGALQYNGVVFNEMKGALSDPDSVLYDALSEALFPDTTYRFESGGRPEDITTLDYDSFLDSHLRHYNAQNSYVILYGNMDPEPFFELVASALDGARKPEGQPNPLNLQEPIVAKGVRRRMATAPENSCAAVGFVAGVSEERERMVAIQVLMDAIMGSNEAPMKRALLDADIADECEGFLADSVAQPFASITARGLHGDDSADRLLEIVYREAKRLSSGGLDMGIVEAALSHAEFVMREGDFGYADGVIYSMASMNGWLYDDSPESALSYIRYEDVFASLRGKLEGDYFPSLVRELFVDSSHYAQVEVVPVDSDADSWEEERLSKLQASLSGAELAEIAEEAAQLHLEQMAPDSPDALAKLPKLSRSDIGDPPFEAAFTVEKAGQMDVLRHNVETHGIVYAAKYFDLGVLDFEDLPYAAILALVLGKMDTERHSASEIDTLVQSKLGSLDFACEVYESAEDVNAWKAKFRVSSSALSKNVESLSDMVSEILQTTLFEDFGRLQDVLVQCKVSMEQRFAMSGNSVATARAASYSMPAAVIREQLGNIDFYKFLKGLLDGFEEKAQGLASKLSEVSRVLFTDDGCLLSFAGTQADFERYMNSGAELGISLEAPERLLRCPQLEDRHEAFLVPADIAYCALVCDRRSLDGLASSFSGAWMVVSRILSYDYLWNEVRVVGGAYGTGFSAARTGAASFSSFRDPHVIETLDRFRASGRWLSAYDPSEDEFEGYVVSTAASFDKPLKPKGLVRRQASMYISGYTREQFLRYRQQVLESDVESVKELSEAVSQICEKGSVCVVGSRSLVEQSGAPLSSIDLLAL